MVDHKVPPLMVKLLLKSVAQDGMGFFSLNNTEKETWLVQHVPHRICAALAWLNMEGRWAMPKPPGLPNRDFHVWCIGRSIDEGRKAAMRWLIEFIGVMFKPGKPAKNGKPAEIEKAVAPKPHPNGKSVTICQVGGVMFDTNSQDALKLAKIWQACSQASLHPTMDTNHCDIEPDDLAGALKIVLAHLETGLYKPSGRDLWKIVHEQEEMAIARERAGSEQNASIQRGAPPNGGPAEQIGNSGVSGGPPSVS